MKSLVPLILLLIMLFVSACGPGDTATEKQEISQAVRPASQPESTSGIQWLDWDEGIEKLVGTTRFGLVYFDTTDCPPCYWMEDSTWSDPEVIAAIEKDFIPIRIRTARNRILHYQGRELTESHFRKIMPVVGYPFTMFIEGATNNMVGGKPSIIPPKDMLDLLGFLSSGAFQTFEYDEYLKAKRREESKAKTP